MSNRSPRLALVALAVVAVGVAVTFFAAGRGGDSTKSTTAGPTAGTSGGATAGGSTTTPTGARPRPGDPGSATNPAGPTGSTTTTTSPGGVASPTGPAGGPGVEAPLGETTAQVDAGVVQYVMEDGTVVRDHRRSPSPPVATVPTPPEERTMNPDVTARVYRELVPAVGLCSAKVPESALGKEPSVYINMTVDVRGGRLATTGVVPVARDVEELAASALTACVREGVSKISVDAKGEPDRTGYVLQYPIRVRTPR